MPEEIAEIPLSVKETEAKQTAEKTSVEGTVITPEEWRQREGETMTRLKAVLQENEFPVYKSITQRLGENFVEAWEKGEEIEPSETNAWTRLKKDLPHLQIKKVKYQDKRGIDQMAVVSTHETEDGLKIYQIFNPFRTAQAEKGIYATDALLIQDRENGKLIDLGKRLPPNCRLLYLSKGKPQDYGYINGEVRYGDLLNRGRVAPVIHEAGHAWVENISPPEYSEVGNKAYLSLYLTRAGLAQGETIADEDKDLLAHQRSAVAWLEKTAWYFYQRMCEQDLEKGMNLMGSEQISGPPKLALNNYEEAHRSIPGNSFLSETWQQRPKAA